MDWIIDGYNVLIGNDLGSDEAARLKMGVLIEDRFRGKQATVTVVYDSRGSTSVQRRKVAGGIGEVFVNNADKYIVDRIRNSRHPRSIILVTDDRADIISRVRGLGIKLVGSAEFLNFIAGAPAGTAKPEKPDRESPAGTERYLRLFGEDKP